jgi:vitamin B12 transporter
MLFLSACALCASIAAAPTPSPSPTAAPPEIAHVYTSERSDVTLKNTARTTYVINRSEIDRNGYRTVGEALQDVPALTVSPYGTTGSTVDFSLRGSSSAQVLVLVDGLPAPGSFSNSVELGNLPTSGVDRIEVVEGGGSTLYGTGAIGGIINIITERTSPARLTLRDGSFADREIEVDTPNVQFYRVSAQNVFPLPGAGSRTDSDYASTALHGNLDRHAGAFDIALRAGIESDHLGAPGPDSFLSLTSRQDDENENANLTVAHGGAQSNATLQIGGSTQHILFQCDSANDPDCYQTLPSLSSESRLDAGLRNLVRGTNEQLLYGIDLSRGVVRGDSGGFAVPDISYGTMAQSAAYVQEHVDARAASFYAGLRGERDGGFGGEFSPSAGFVLRPSGELAFKGNIATAFRAPNATEIYYPGYGNPFLNPERAKVADLSFTDSAILGGTTIGWFGNRTNNLILPEPVTAPGPGCPIDQSSFVYQPCNIGHALMEGLTLVSRTQSYNGFVASLNVTDLYRAENLDAGTRLPNDPVISANLRLDYTAPAQDALLAAAGVAARSMGARGAVDTTKPLFDQPAPFTSIDAYVRVRAGSNMLLSLRGYNLGNERYAAVSGYPMPGRSYLVELTAK